MREKVLQVLDVGHRGHYFSEHFEIKALLWRDFQIIFIEFVLLLELEYQLAKVDFILLKYFIWDHQAQLLYFPFAAEESFDNRD